MKKISLNLIIFCLILVLAGALRFYKLGEVPIELNRDEASLGYTAFSILKTGHEDHGAYWPINIESFGDWKLPVYVYTLIPFIKVFGLLPWVVKLPSALAGLGIVAISWILAWKLSEKVVEPKWRAPFAHLVMLLLAISPWDIHLSHMAYEAHLGMLLMLTATTIFVFSMENRNTTRRWWLVLSTILFGLTLFTYHSYQVFTPLFAIALLFTYKNESLSLLKKSKTIFATCALVAGFFSLSLILTSIKANQTKFAALSIFDKKAYAPIVEINRGYFENRNNLFAKIRDNYPSLLINQIQRNITDLYSTKFFFFEGGTHGSHDIAGTGKMYPVEGLFLLIAGYQILKKWQAKTLDRSTKLIIGWLLIASIAPIITFEAAHAIRFSPALFALGFLSAFGLLNIIKSYYQFFTKIFLLTISGILIYSVIYFVTTYFVIAPQRDINLHNWQIKTLIGLINDRYDQYDKIALPGATWSPYIYFLFYNQVDPATLSEQIEYFPTGSDGFRHVKRLGKLEFSDVDWNEDNNKNTLYVIKQKEVPGDKLESNNYQLEYSLTKPLAKDEWLLLSHP